MYCQRFQSVAFCLHTPAWTEFNCCTRCGSIVLQVKDVLPVLAWIPCVMLATISPFPSSIDSTTLDVIENPLFGENLLAYGSQNGLATHGQWNANLRTMVYYVKKMFVDTPFQLWEFWLYHQAGNMSYLQVNSIIEQAFKVISKML